MSGRQASQKDTIGSVVVGVSWPSTVGSDRSVERRAKRDAVDAVGQNDRDGRWRPERVSGMRTEKRIRD